MADYQSNTDVTTALMNLRPSMIKAKDEKELTSIILEECIRLTNSEVGYLHFYDEEKKDIVLNYWSKNVFANCGVNQSQHYPLEKAGIWADCVRVRKSVIHNDYVNYKDKKGVPEGHFPIKRHMSVPVFDEAGKLVVIFGVGNKVEPYDDTDVEKLQIFGNALLNTFAFWRKEKVLDDKMQELKKLGV